MELENMLQEAAEKFSKFLEIDCEVETPVIDFVVSCLCMESFQGAIPEEEILETLEAISSYEAGQNEEVDIEDGSEDKVRF